MASFFKRTMVYLGLADEDEYDGYQEYDAPIKDERLESPQDKRADHRWHDQEGELEREHSRASNAQGVGIRTIHSSWAPQGQQDSSVSGGNATRTATAPRSSVVRPIAPERHPLVHVVAPTKFSDAREIADRFMGNQPVIVNLQVGDRELTRRMIDFCSGVAYALRGSMEKVADQVFLLTPSNVEVPAEERQRLQERGLFRQ
ncbi:MAG: cell division protein SepF [Actinobacteria bacterium]|jgi:cell division inhibitor SepF|nr:cell division protein SepF [Actinomycetota bacterium]MCL6095283.1 cell division protein SepF [Actinomycetota bacterium]